MVTEDVKLKKDKLRNLILRILNEAKEPISKVKLAKLVLFAEIEYFKKYGRSITDLYFVRLDYGPVIAFFQQTLSEGEEKEWERRKEPIYISELKRKRFIENYIAKEKPVSLGEDIDKVIKRVVNKYGKLTGTRLSLLAHRLPAWKYSEPNAPIYLVELTKEKEEEYFGLLDALENIDDTTEMEKKISQLLSAVSRGA